MTRLRLLDDCMAKTRNGIVRDADTRLLEDLRDRAERSVLGAQASDAVFVGHERPKSRGQLPLEVSDSGIEKQRPGELLDAVAHRSEGAALRGLACVSGAANRACVFSRGSDALITKSA